MKKILCLYFLLFIMFSSFGAKVPFTVYTDTVATTKATNLNKISDSFENFFSNQSYQQVTLKDVRKALGRKLTLKEKIQWFLLKNKFQHGGQDDIAKRHANSNAVLGFFFSIIGLAVFPLFIIPALILSIHALKAEKTHPGILTATNRSLAKAAEIISIVDIVLLIFGLIILIAFLSQLRFG